MVKLVYHSTTGPIALEYEQALISVGSAADNDLVLPHPSVQPYHCKLALQADSVQEQAWDGSRVAADVISVGGKWQVGELEFDVQEAGASVAIPQGALAQHALPVDDPDAPYYCESCQLHFHDHQVKRVGLQGKAKHVLCPRCSRPLVLSQREEAPPSGIVQKIKRGFLRLFGAE